MVRWRGIGLYVLLMWALTGCDLLTGNQPPVAIIEASPTRGDAPLRVEFDGSLSFDPQGLLVRYEWDFGDGTRAEGPKVTHVYRRNGVYIATLTVSDQFGARGQDRVRIVVGNPPPQAIFTASPIRGWPPLIVTFDGSVSFDPEGDAITSYEWDFGDGQSASGPRATHTYAEGGRFVVQLTITDQGGAISTATLTVHVLDFMSAQDLRVGRSPVSAVTADLDGDGRLDVAVVNSESNEVSLFFGGGQAGSLIRGERISVGRRPVALTSADLDGDGRLDLAVAHLDSGSVTLLWNDGNRGLQRGDELRIGRWASAITSADFNRDGWSDLAVADAGTDQVTVLLGNGEGVFEIASTIPVGRWPAALVSGDFDEDGRPDLAVANFHEDSITLLFGDGVGGFREGGLRAVGEGPVALASLDLDGDARLDLVVANSKSANLSVLLGAGRGRFSLAPDIPVGEGVHGLAVGDFDGDGSLDLASANSSRNTVTVLLNDGVGQFRTRSQAREYPADGSPVALVAGDFDQDGFLDLVIVHFEEDRISILLNQL